MPDGKRLAVLSSDVGILIYSFETGKVEKHLPVEMPSPYTKLSLSMPCILVAADTTKNRLLCWNVESGETVWEFPIANLLLQGPIAVSPGGHDLAIDNGTGVQLIHVRKARQPASPPRMRRAARRRSLFRTMARRLPAYSNSGTQIMLCAWSVSDGKKVLEDKLEEPMYRLYPDAASYRGNPLEWLADGSGWLLYGGVWIDRQNGGPAWVDSESQSLHRALAHIVDAERMLVVQGEYTSMSLQLVKIPKEKMAAGAKLLAKGGTADNVGLPPLTPVDLSSVKNITLPGAGPWRYSPDGADNVDTLAASPIPLGWQTTAVDRLRFSTAAAGRLLVTSRPQPAGFSGGSKPMCSLYDLKTGKMESQFDTPCSGELLDMSPDGRQIVFRTGKNKDRIDVWSVADHQHVAALRPPATDRIGQQEIEDARFIDSQHLLTAGPSGRLICWTLPQCKPVYALNLGILARPILTPGRHSVLTTEISILRLVDARSGEYEGTLAPPVSCTGALRCGFSRRWRRTGRRGWRAPRQRAGGLGPRVRQRRSRDSAAEDGQPYLLVRQRSCCTSHAGIAAVRKVAGRRPQAAADRLAVRRRLCHRCG